MDQNEIPSEVSAVGLGDWYSDLSPPDKVKVRRYLPGIDTSSPRAFVVDLMGRSTEDHNYKLSAAVGRFASTVEMDAYSRFLVNEAWIEGLFGGEMYEEAKKVCCDNLDLYPEVRDAVLADNGGEVPKHMSCRNRLIDIVIGVESQYEMADELLSGYVDLGLIDEEEKAYRMQSIKIHRMQKTFDNLFIYRPKQ